MILFKTRFLLSLLFTLLTILLFYIGGFDFNERGGVALLCMLYSIFVFFATYTAPITFKDEK